MPLPTITASLWYITITYDIRVPRKYLYLVIVLGIESGFFFVLVLASSKSASNESWQSFVIGYEEIQQGVVVFPRQGMSCMNHPSARWLAPRRFNVTAEGLATGQEVLASIGCHKAEQPWAREIYYPVFVRYLIVSVHHSLNYQQASSWLS